MSSNFCINYELEVAGFAFIIDTKVRVLDFLSIFLEDFIRHS